MPLLRLLFTLLCGVVLARGALAGQFVVIASDDPALKRGCIVTDASPITVAAGSMVTLLSEQGRSIRLQGPFSGRPAGKLSNATAIFNVTLWSSGS